MTFTSSRRSYERDRLTEEHAGTDPLALLRTWLDEAYGANVPEPNAMVVATQHDGQPSSRIVLLRGLDDRGLVFYTSYFSRKGREIAGSPLVALLFFWPQLERQVRVEGTSVQLSDDESDAYFASRPRGHQLGAWASEQSEPIERRELLEERMNEYASRFEGEDVPRPHSWGGYLVRPQRFEFWQGRANRLHDRLEFLLHGRDWRVQRLQP